MITPPSPILQILSDLGNVLKWFLILIGAGAVIAAVLEFFGPTPHDD